MIALITGIAFEFALPFDRQRAILDADFDVRQRNSRNIGLQDQVVLSFQDIDGRATMDANPVR